KGPGGLPVLDRKARWCDVATRREVVPAEGLLLAFALAASGKTDRQVVRALNEAGYRTSGNRGQNPFTRDTIREILTNRFYLGELPDGSGGWVGGKHGALIDPNLFDRAQRARDANTTRPLRVATDASPWALSGVATCGTCGKSLRAYGRSSGRRRVQCAGRAEGNGCDEPTFFADVLEDQMGALLARFEVPASDQAVLLNAWRRSQSRSVDVAAERLRIRRKLDRLKDLYLEGDLDQTTWRAQKTALQEELATLPPEGDPDSEAGKRLAAFLRNVASAWRVATPDERNRLARQLFVEAIVENRTAVALLPRPHVRPFFETLACQVPDEVTRWRKRRGSESRARAFRASTSCHSRSAAPTSSGGVRFGAAIFQAYEEAHAGGGIRNPGSRRHQEPALAGSRLRSQPRDDPGSAMSKSPASAAPG
nr:recombinase family protein [Chloroflexota bacterium]